MRLLALALIPAMIFVFACIAEWLSAFAYPKRGESEWWAAPALFAFVFPMLPVLAVAAFLVFAWSFGCNMPWDARP